MYLHADNEGLFVVQLCFGDTSMFLKLTPDEFANARGYARNITVRVFNAYRNESEREVVLSSCDFGADLCSVLVGHSVGAYSSEFDNIIILLLSYLYEVYSNEVIDNTGRTLS